MKSEKPRYGRNVIPGFFLQQERNFSVEEKQTIVSTLFCIAAGGVKAFRF